MYFVLRTVKSSIDKNEPFEFYDLLVNLTFEILDDIKSEAVESVIFIKTVKDFLI